MRSWQNIAPSLLAGLILAVVTAGVAQAQDSNVAGNGRIDEKAKSVVENAGKFYRGLDGFHTRMEANIETEVAEQQFKVELVHQIDVERPNKLSLFVESDAQTGATGMVKSDGEQLVIYLSAFNKYLPSEAPETLAELQSNPLVMGITGAGNSGVVTLALLAEEPATALLENVTSLEYVGTEKIEDVECHHLAATQEDFDWEIWIETGKRPLVHQFKPDMAKMFKRMAKQANNPDIANAKISNVVRYTEWALNPEPKAETFAFDPPEDAKKVDSMAALIRGDDAGGGMSPEELVGKPAPAFKLDRLEGGEVELASHRGQDVVILDFWASWCGPCRQAMPIIDKVADEYEKKGVVLYAVNLQEDEDTIRQALEEDEIEPAVLMDVEGKVARLYQAQAIPQTVLIGKDGTVEAVHVGLLPNLEEQLREEIETLLAGKSLVVAEESDDSETE